MAAATVVKANLIAFGYSNRFSTISRTLHTRLCYNDDPMVDAMDAVALVFGWNDVRYSYWEVSSGSISIR